MIPASLTLSNFTSYGTQVPTLDFRQFHMAAISGSNGAGKSSLLDSITWCLWGSSRLGDSSDQLVRLGTSEMSVEFSFDLDGHKYTVKRKRSLKSGGATSLEFFSSSHNLTEGTIKATQQKIIDTLHLTFETFVNSAFIRQGHADEFTTKGATERKKILADILGLGNYDLLEEKAKEKAKEAATKIQLLDYQLLEIEAEVSQKEEKQKALSAAEQEAKEAEKQLKNVEQLVKSIEAEREVVILKKRALEEKAQRIKKVQQELLDLKLQISLKERARQDNESILTQKEDIEKKYQSLKDLNEQRKILEEKRSELIKVKDEWAKVLKILTQRKENRDKEITKLEIQVKKLETQNEEKKSLNQKLKDQKELCPTCGQQIELKTNQEIINRNLSVMDENDKKITDLKTKIEKFLKYAFPEEQQASGKEKLVASIEAETKNYFDIVSKISELKKYEDLNIKLQQAQASIKTHAESIEDLQKIYKDREKQIEEDNQEILNLEIYQKQLTEVEERIRAEEVIKHELSQKLLQAKGMVGAAKQIVDRATQLEEIFRKKSDEKGDLKKQKDSFEELVLAFGKKGIQAMIIETAVPEIEDEANSLLDRLTEGRMIVRFDTQKETKAGTTVETLDIIISDEMGERPYEAYSGGEQFRVNFAIRLALSKLLTHRAGSKLQFLVVDEGFGTQDAQGRSRIVEALDVVKNDFEKIVIITHLEELKEEFPARVEVSKGPEGSTFKVIV